MDGMLSLVVGRRTERQRQRQSAVGGNAGRAGQEGAGKQTPRHRYMTKLGAATKYSKPGDRKLLVRQVQEPCDLRPNKAITL